jgi:glutamate/tyrosine decarboxylase-like PLP-dependent enzyme
MRRMHSWDEHTELFAPSVIGYAIERLRLPKDPKWGVHPGEDLGAEIGHAITPEGIGALDALHLFRDVLMPSCRPMDHPMNLAYVATAPTIAASMFDLVVSASSIFGGLWEAGAGAITAENQALAWLAGLAGYPDSAGGCFVSGGSAANLSALVTAREVWLADHERGAPLAIAATYEVHASVRAAAKVMDVAVVEVGEDERGRMTGPALEAALANADGQAVFAVVCTGGTTNAGMVDDLAGIADVCARRGLWMHVDGAYGLAALCAPSARPLFDGIERSDSFGVDPHKWLFAPYDCAALVYRRPLPARLAHAQHGDYLEVVDRTEWNPADYAYHLSRRARGLPLWFSLAAYGTDAYRDAVERTLSTAHAFADAVDAHPDFELVMRPELSVVLFRRRGWDLAAYRAWSAARARDGTVLIVPTFWKGEAVMRICVVNPLTDPDAVIAVLADMASSRPAD